MKLKTDRMNQAQRDARKLERKISDLQYAINVYSGRGDSIEEMNAREQLAKAQARYEEMFLD